MEGKTTTWRGNVLVLMMMAGLVALVVGAFLAIQGQYELAVATASPFVALAGAICKDLVNPDQGHVPGAIAGRLIDLVERPDRA